MTVYDFLLYRMVLYSVRFSNFPKLYITFQKKSVLTQGARIVILRQPVGGGFPAGILIAKQ